MWHDIVDSANPTAHGGIISRHCRHGHVEARPWAECRPRQGACTVHVLVVEDEWAIADLLRRGLSAERHVVDVADSGDAGLARAETDAYDAIILDLMLPGMDGLQIARRLRAEGNTTPILMLTARDTLDDRLRGFDAGADDYLCKPFAFEELMARLRAITRRGAAPVEEDCSSSAIL